MTTFGNSYIKKEIQNNKLMKENVVDMKWYKRMQKEDTLNLEDVTKEGLNYQC